MSPAEICGDCYPYEELKAELYPSWATDEDIQEASRNGLVLSEQRPSDWRVCPADSYKDNCDSGKYWDELACECFSLAQCKKGCGIYGERLDPKEMCG